MPRRGRRRGRRGRWGWWLLGAVAALCIVLLVVLPTGDDDRADGPEPPSGEEDACRWSSVPMIRDATAGRVQEVQAALDDGVTPTRVDAHGNTALACAGPVGEAEVVAMLLDAGADPDTVARDGDTVVADAVRFCQPDVLDLLLDAGADPDESGTDESPLVQAVRRGATDEVTLLLAADARPDLSPHVNVLLDREEGSRCAPTPASRAAALGLVLDAGGEPDDVLVEAVHQRAWAVVGPALAVGAAPDTDVGLGLGVLACAGPEPEIEECDPATGVAVLDGQPVDVARIEAEGQAAAPVLIHAAWEGEAGAVDALLVGGADPDAVGPLGVTALAAAAGAGHEEVVDLLLPAVSLPVEPATVVPSAVAATAGHPDLASRLRAAGA